MWRDEVKLCEAKVALAEIKMEAAKDSGERLCAKTALAAAHSLLRIAIRDLEGQLQQSQMSMGVDLTPSDGGDSSVGGYGAAAGCKRPMDFLSPNSSKKPKNAAAIEKDSVGLWQWCDDSGIWINYLPSESVKLDAAMDVRDARCAITVDGDTIVVDLEQMVQRREEGRGEAGGFGGKGQRERKVRPGIPALTDDKMKKIREVFPFWEPPKSKDCPVEVFQVASGSTEFEKVANVIFNNNVGSPSRVTHEIVRVQRIQNMSALSRHLAERGLILERRGAGELRRL